MARPLLRNARKAITGAAAALCLTATATPAEAFLDTEKAWNDLLQFAVRQVNAPGEFEIELGQVTRPEDGFALISSLKIRDGDGVWLDSSGLLVDWNPTSLLRGRFSFETLSADEIKFLRAPITRGDPPGEKAQIDFAWPRPPVSLVVENLRIKELLVEGGLLPQDLRAKVEGRFYDLGDIQETTLSLKRLDRPGDTVDLGTRIDFDDMDISFSLEAHEAPGGLVAEISGLPETEAIEVTLAAAGDPSSLPFTLYADIGQIGIAEGEGVAQWQDKTAVTFDGRVEPGEETAQRWRDALGQSARIKLDAEETADGAYRLTTLHIDSEAAELSGQGVVDTAGNTIDMAFDWAAKDIAALNAVIAPAQVSAVSGSAKAVGALTAPKVDVNATLSGLKAGFGEVGDLQLRIDSAPEGEGTDTASGIQGFSFVAKADGLALADPALQDALGPDPTLKGNGAFYGNEGQVVLETVSVETRTITLDGNATYDIDPGSLNAELSGSAGRIGPFLKAAGIPVDGAADLALKIKNLTAESVERLFLNAQLTQLSSSDPNYAALIGETAVLEALLVEAEPGVVKIDRGFFESATVRAEASGSFSVPQDTVDLALDWRLIDARRLAPIIEPAQLGGAQGKAAISGTLSEPKADIDASLTGLAAESYAAERAEAKIEAQLRKDRRVPFSIAADLEGFTADDPTVAALAGGSPTIVASGIYDEATTLLTLGDARITAASGAFTLSGDVNPRQKTLDIAYGLDTNDLDAIGTAAGVPLGGSVNAKGQISGKFSAPIISTEADVRDLKFHDYEVDVLDLSLNTAQAGDGDNPFSLDLTAKGLSLGDPDLDALIGDSPTVTAKGTYNPEGPRVSLETFSAALQQATATASGDVDVAAKTLDVEFDLDANKLDGLAPLLGSEIAGTLAAKGSARGSFSAPEVDVDLDGAALRYGDYSVGSIKGRIDLKRSETGFAPFDIDVIASEVDLGDPALNDLIGESAAIKAKGAYDRSSLAVRLDNAEFDTAAVTGTAAGSLNLGRRTLDLTYDIDAQSLEPIGTVAGVDLAGAVSAKGSASGSFAAPQIDTTLTGRALRYGGYKIAKIDGEIDIQQAETGYAPFDIDINASGINLGDEALNKAIGSTATVKANGGFDQSEQRVRIDKARAVTDAATVAASGTVDLDDETLDVEFDLDAKALAPFSVIVGEDLAGALKASGRATGSFSAPALDTKLTGRKLRYGQYSIATIDGEVDVQQNADGPAPFDIDVTASGIDLGDANLNTAIGGQAAITAKGSFDQSVKILRLESARAITDAASASASGVVNLAKQTLDIDFDVDARSLAPFSVFAGAELGGSFAANGTLNGAFTAPSIDAELSGQSLRYGQYSIGAIDGTIEIPPASEGLAPFSVDVIASGISLGDPALDALIGERAAIAANGRIDQVKKIIQLQDFSASTRAISATASGQIDLGAQTLDLAFDIDAADLSPATGLTGVPIGGALKASGTARGPFSAPILDVTASGAGLTYDKYSVSSLDIDLDMQGESGGRIPFTLDARASQPRLGNPAIEALLGETVTLTAKGTLDQANNRVELREAIATAGVGAVLAGGVVDLGDQSLNLIYSAHLPALGMLQPLAGKPLGGEARLNGRLTGPFADPATTGTLEGHGVFYDTYQLGSLTARYDVQRLITGPAGEVSLDANTPQGPLTLSSAFDLTGGALRIESLSVDGLGLNVAGNFRSLPGGLYEGDMMLSAADLAPLGALAGQQIAGTADGTVRLSAEGGRQNAAVDLSATGFSYSQNGKVIATVNSISVSGQVGDAFSADPVLDTTLNATQAVIMGFPVQQVQITAQGPLSSLNTTISGSGGQTGSDRIDIAARLTLVGFPRGAEISSLSASYKGARLASASIFRVTELQGGGWRAEGLNLRLDDGEIVGSGEYSPAGVAAKLSLRNVPLQLTQLSGFDLIQTGRLYGDVNIDTRGAPRGDFDLTATVLRLKGAQLDDPFDLKVSGTLDGRALNATAIMKSGLIRTPLEASASIPLMQTAGSPLPLPDRNAPFTAQVDWSGDISEFWAFVPAPDHVLSGPIELRGRASGTLNAPQLEGGAILTGARYQHLDFGTLLDQLNARADFTQDGRVIFEATATDGVTGSVSAQGSYVVADSAIDASLNLNQAALVRRDDLTAIISGDASAKGSLKDLAVKGAFRTNFVEFRLVGGYGGSLVVVDAIPVGETAPLYVPPSEEPESQRISLDVSLNFPQQVFVRGRGLDSEWGGQIRATGYASNPRVNGVIAKRRGWLDLLGRQFELSIGEVRFSGPLDPYIRIRLQREANDITGWLDVTGPASDLEIGFGSIPALSPDEVLPRLLFGRSKQSLSGLEAAQLAAGVATLLSGKDGAIDSVRGALGVDVLRVEGGDEDGTSVSTGKYLAPGVFVGAKQNLTTGGTSAIVEIEVFDNIEIEAELGAEESKGSANWKLDY